MRYIHLVTQLTMCSAFPVGLAVPNYSLWFVLPYVGMGAVEVGCRGGGERGGYCSFLELNSL